MPSWSLSEPFCSTLWSMAVYLSSSPSCLATCRLAVVLSIFGWLDTSHYFVEFKISKARFMLKSRCTGLWRLGLFAEVRVVKAIPACGGDCLHRRVQELHTSTTSLIFGLWMNLVSCNHSVVHCVCPMLSVNSPNATSLHSRCIWEGVLEYNSQG